MSLPGQLLYDIKVHLDFINSMDFYVFQREKAAPANGHIVNVEPPKVNKPQQSTEKKDVTPKPKVYSLFCNIGILNGFEGFMQ